MNTLLTKTVLFSVVATIGVSLSPNRLFAEPNDCAGSDCVSGETTSGDSVSVQEPPEYAVEGGAPCDESVEGCLLVSGEPIDASREYPAPRPTRKTWLHGFRMGAVYIFNFDKERESIDSPVSLKERYDLKSPWMFALGYEGMRRIVGHSWLNIILVGNVTVVGLEQSKFIPTANGLVGFEFDESFQIGVGANLTPEDQKPLHMILAAGWTPNVGSFSLPVHLTLVPDVDGNHRLGTTVGVNW